MANQVTNTTLKTRDHSRYGVSGVLTTPYYDRDTGVVCLRDNTFNQALPHNYLKPGRQYFVTANVRLQAKVTDGAITASDNTFTSVTANFTSGDVGKAITVAGAGTAGANLITTIASYNSATSVELTDAAGTTVSNAVTTFDAIWNSLLTPRLTFGLWDNTAGQRKYLEGNPFTLEGETVGTPASTTSREYFVLAVTDWGTTYASNVITVSDAPADGNFSSSVYVNLQWSAIQGITDYKVYRKTGSTFHYLRSVYPNNSYFDRGTTERTVSDYPTADYDRARAYVTTTPVNFTPTETWQNLVFNVPVPSDYDTSKTTDKQWLRIGIVEALEGAGLYFELDLVSIDPIRGLFTRCPLDFLAKRPLSASPVSQGTVGSGGGTGGGGGGCPVFNQIIDCEVGGKRTQLTAIELYREWKNNRTTARIINRKGESVAIQNAVIIPFSEVIEVETENSCTLRASDTQPIFLLSEQAATNRLKNMRIGDKIQTRFGVSEVIRIERLNKRESTIKFSIAGLEKGYWMNDVAGSNSKNPEV